MNGFSGAALGPRALTESLAARPRSTPFAEVFLASLALARSGPLLVLALGVFALRLPSLSFDVLNVDESVYHLMGQAWLHGTAPHLGIVDNKPLGLYAIHALAGAIFNDPIAGARLLGAFATFIAAALLMRIAETFLGLSRWGAMAGGLLFATYAILLGGDASQGPVFYGPLLAGGALLIMTEIATLTRGAAPSVARLGLAGLLLGLSLQIKYVTVFECAAFGMFYLRAAWRAGSGNGAVRARGLMGAAALVAGGLAPTALVIAAYAAVGEGGTFIFYTFVANATRAMNQEPLPVILGRMGLILFAMAPLMAPSFEYLRAPGNLARPRWVKLFLAAWFASAMLGGVAQLQFYDHYFYEAVLPLAVMAAAALHGTGVQGSPLRDASGANVSRRSGKIATAMLLGMAVVGYTGVRALAVDYNGPKNLPSIVARDIGAAGARSMYVFNGHTLLHLLTGIPLPTRYPLADHLLRDINADMFGFNARTEMARVLEGDQDVVVVHRPISPTVSEDRKKLLEDKLAADYCLWRQYPSGAHQVDVYLLNAFSGRATCAAPQRVAVREGPATRVFPRPRKAARRVMMADVASDMGI